ncbi:uncharacterized protein LOC115707083 isoform X1 [Cannabis sativa]|uniref:Uncharacterized protein n=3 Tax=Cannabis sativa TaxID=3483 RepID=A0A7J6HD33_CANSA|nr:uncharacterized protein LOC115707083 isoform X1 [Cannabis sativa]XP_030490780.2 uncharacterized protein LOC115707083 isoform X1 [Cannabis sativa]XP_030490781.2 uncharacterized protein LOC115707083 isoform X1 [Cannabis sativa]XP_030490782.2 uncharacterized protein LOC115707083 isoform X1 [Cannabis sativa]KAF4386625.1 hypothetical protein F8388_006580 [Cannabis sativa]KAF4392965.1 hypothetical protein G4B88_011960 [Cannabis sativa]
MKMLNRLISHFCFPSRVTLQQFSYNRCSSFLYHFSSVSSPAITTSSNSDLVICLINTYKLTKMQALSISNRYPLIKSPNKPQLVHKFFLERGFSKTHIQSMILVSSQIMFSDVNKTLRPKIEVFQQLGIEGFELGKFISKNPTVLTRSLKKKLVPCIEILKNFFGDNGNNKDFIRIFSCRWNLWNPQRLLANCTFLESCGIVGPQLSLIMKRQPHIFTLEDSKLKELVSKVSDMGFKKGSKMFPHGLYAVSGISDEACKKKLDLICSLGFSEGECKEMFRRSPLLFRTSPEKLKFGVDFYLNTVKLKRSRLIHAPWILMSSMKKRVIPRYKVLQLLKSKRLFKREPSFYSMVLHTEAEFLQNFIFRFKDDSNELLEAYMSNLSDSSDQEDKS